MSVCKLFAFVRSAVLSAWGEGAHIDLQHKVNAQANIHTTFTLILIHLVDLLRNVGLHCIARILRF